MQEDNRKGILNMIRYYTDAPAALKLRAEPARDEGESGEQSTRARDLRGALQRRYERNQTEE